MASPHPTAVAPPPAPRRSTADRWLRVHGCRSARPVRRLVCFPHAGGTAHLFHGWPTRLPDDTELLAVRYPGRQDRLAEPCAEDMAELADAVAESLAPFTGLPLTLFGHSMGAAVAHEVALRLAARGAPPAHLLVSGRAAPHRAAPTGVADGDDEALLAVVRGLGDYQAEAYDIPELRELLLPALRADYRLIESYRPRRPAPLRTPVTAYTGVSDPSCPVEDVRAWAELTEPGRFTLCEFPGDHFYLVPHEAELVADITARIA